MTFRQYGFPFLFVLLPSIHLFADALDLKDIEYEGSWDNFCDAKEIENDFLEYPEHDLKYIRKIICEMRQRNQTNQDRKLLLMFGSYRYCSLMRPFFEDFFDSLLDLFSASDDEKRAILLTPGPVNETTSCFNQTLGSFSQLCVGSENPCTRMFKSLLARTCVQPWLGVGNMLSYIDIICSGNLISDQIDWDAIFRTMNQTITIN